MSKNLVKMVGNGVVATGEKAVSEMALVSGAASAFQDGSFIERVAGGIYAPVELAKNFAESYVANDGFRDVFNQAAVSAMQYVGSLGNNIADNPKETIASVLATYAICKALPAASSFARKKLYSSKAKE